MLPAACLLFPCAVVLLAAGLAALYWTRRRRAAKAAAQDKQQQDKEAARLNAQQIEEGRAPGFDTGSASQHKQQRQGSSGMQPLLSPHGPGVPVGLLGHSLGM